MFPRFRAIFALAACSAALTGCKQESTPNQDGSAPTQTEAAAKLDPKTSPDLSPARKVQPGIQWQEAKLDREGVPMKIWYYQPIKAPDKLALVLVPPAGSTLVAGMVLGDGDRPEHYPYAKAGFAVASFEIDGNVPRGASNKAIVKGACEFRAADAGLANARVALDFLLARVPAIDPNRVYIAGHSSAGTLALLVAEHDPRIKACIAYAPCTDVEARLHGVSLSLESSQPGYKDFLHNSSPRTHAAKLKCPLFLFHAEDDHNVSIRESKAFAALVKKSNPNVTLITVPEGGHYDPMIREGIPRAIQWLKKLPKTGS